MLSDESEGFQKILLESIAKTISLIVEVLDGIIGLYFGRPEKPDNPHFFRARRRANTSSEEIASMFPALYSA